jgi:lipopolysaccharide/colanic/teichoic acid biosynthesis glycosyltransferase
MEHPSGTPTGADRSNRPAQVRIKYALDRVFAAAFLAVLSPILGLISLCIRLDDGGPVLFRHRRVGTDGHLFDVVKFRTMVVDADRYLDGSGAVTPGRDRVTRVGRVLRRWSLDELPQLVNVVRGEMSLVGPRPALPEHLERYTPEQRRRLRMKPGITGLAQVRGRNTLPWSERIRLDNEYIDRYSLLLDLGVLFRTTRVVLLREGFRPDRNPREVDDLNPPRIGETDG